MYGSTRSLHHQWKSNKGRRNAHNTTIQSFHATMDTPGEHRARNPFPYANWISRLFVCWAVPLIKLGNKRRIEHEDAYKVPDCYETRLLTKRLEKTWEEELVKRKNGGTPSYRKALAKAFGWDYAKVAIIVLIEDLSRLIQPILLQYLIQYFEPNSAISTSSAYLLATGIAVCTILEMFSGPAIVFAFMRCGLTWQSSTCGLMYRKLLRLSNESRSTATSGYITDLISSDSEKLDWMVWFIHGLWQAPFHVIVVMPVLYHQLGAPVFASLLVISLMLPLQGVIAKVIAHYKDKNLSAMDERVGIVGEIISAMRVIKMYCWEKPFGDIVGEIRRRELRYIWKQRVFSSMLSELYTFNQRFITALIVLVYVSIHGDFTASKVFPAFALFNILSESLLNQIPWGIKNWLEVGVSAKRIQNFLLMEEVDTKKECQNTELDTGDVRMDKVTASWSVDSSKPTLENINLSCKSGDLVMLLGEVGSGKSSILMSIMGELPATSGKSQCLGKLAYVPQQPWVFSSTVRQNILFGKEFNSENYYRVIKAAALDKDISELAFGDMTLVGEKGISLSGGQKARVALARALYADADIYLLDDPLSAVDNIVGNQIMKRSIKGLLKDKTVILATHQLHYLQEASNILIMNNGKVETSGTYSDLLDQGTDFGKVIHEDDEQRKLKHQFSSESTTSNSDVIATSNEAQKAEEEEREYGNVSWSVYKEFFLAGTGWPVVILFFSLCIATQATYNIGDWWLSQWADSSDNSTAQPTTDNSTVTHSTSPDNKSYAAVYITFLLAMILLGISRSWLFFRITTNTSRTLHERVYQCVVRAPIRFFDTTPKGRIINRFSGDMGKVDDVVPTFLMEFIQHFFMVGGSVFLVMIINPYIVFIGVPVMIALIMVRKAYLATQRHMSRLFSTAKSPMLSHLCNTIEGVHVIRAFEGEGCCIEDYDKHYNLFTGIWVTHMGTFHWFQFWNDCLTGVFNVAVTYICVAGASSLTAGEAGLILSYIVPLMWQIETCLRTSSDVEIEMVGTERVLEYTMLPSERSLDTNPEDAPPHNWPATGKIVFDKMSFAYSLDSPIILDKIDCRIEDGEKIGIVGRTGAGKSSLIQALFRMAEPLGQIIIDYVPINELGLHDVRGNVSIIPQDPVLFSGTVRTNLDPFTEHDDASIWQSLEQVQLKGVVEEQCGGIEGKVTESGSNFSVGQRQLFCLARAILKKKKILILDEATANVDKRTDDLIQQTIRQQFADCTVLTIAHRLNTIMDSDKIMVLEQGKLMDFDAPYVLLQRKGLLYSMLKEMGEQEKQRLTDIARTALMKRTVKVSSNSVKT